MIVLQPVAVTPAALISSTVPETEHSAWAAGTTYPLGARVIRLRRVRESLTVGNVGNPPEASPEAWLDVGPTNRWAMFDPAAGPRTVQAGAVEVELAPAAAVGAIGLVDVDAMSVRVRVTNGTTTLYDKLFAGGGSRIVSDLPQPAGQRIIMTANPTGGSAAVGKLLIGAAYDLGVTSTAPTVGITDYSRRETDDFGVTTVVERSWAKRLTARTRLSSSAVDGVQRKLVDLRAKPALWVADSSIQALAVYGFFKDFSIDLTVGETSYCALTVEGLPTTGGADSGVDPAVEGASDLLVVRPIAVTDAMLTYSSVPETDYAAWAGGTTYALAARVVRAHRVYESLVAGNLGHDPVDDPTRWLDTGPTNRWAMFDQALGTVTSKAGPIVVNLTPTSAISGLGVIDTGGSVRVQAGGYDRTIAAPAPRTFLDLAVAGGTAITVTIGADADGTARAGTLVLGQLQKLGRVETSPTLGISDFSLKDTDDFGSTTVVERAWAKRLSLRSLLATNAADAVLARMAALRATPALWVASDDFDTLQVYGFYRDFGLTISDQTTAAAFTIEGLTKAPPEAAPVVALRPWRAYANSLDGTADFTTGAPDGRAYIGWRIADTASADPADYEWSRLTGPPGEGEVGDPGPPGAGAFTLVPNFASTRITGSTVAGGGGATGWGSDAVYSAEARTGGAALDFLLPAPHGDFLAIGLTQGSGTDKGHGSASITFGVYRNPEDSSVHAQINGANYGVPATVSGAARGRIHFDGRYIRWFVNSTQLAVFDWMSSTGDPNAAENGLRVKAVLAGSAPVIEDIAFSQAGQLGEDGADGYTIAAAPAAVLIRCYANGTPKPDELPRNISINASKAGVDVSSGITLSASAGSGLSVSTSGNVVTVASASNDGAVSVTVTQGSAVIGTAKVPVTRVLDPAPPQSVTEISKQTNNVVSVTAYGIETTIALIQAGAGGNLSVNLYGDYSASGSASNRTVKLAGKLRYRIPGGSWSDIGAEVVDSGQAIAFPGESEPSSLSIAQSVSGLTAGQAYEVEGYLRIASRSPGTTSASFGGVLTVTTS